ncbi:MAG: ATP-binding protein [bacterium]
MEGKDKDIKLEYQILNKIFMRMGDGFLVIDRQKRIKFMNQHLINLYGYKVGKRCHEVFFDSIEPCEGCSINDIIEDDKEVTRHTRCARDKFGRWLEITLIPTTVTSQNHKEKGVCIIEVIHDITARKNLEEAIREKNLELKQKNEELENFVYTVSHDLKSPIFSLQGVVNALIEDYADKLDKGFSDYLEDIRNSAQKMGLLVQDLLNLSRVGRTRNPREEVPAREIIDEAIEQLKFQIESKGVELKIEEDLLTCYCDKQMIILALVNLLDNAIKYMGDTPCPRIEIGCATEGGYQIFSVKDNGIGIDPKYHEKIFEIFQSLGEIKDPKSTGVGLAIVKRVIEVHMGKVWLESEKGRGSKFLFRIPSKEFVQFVLNKMRK